MSTSTSGAITTWLHPLWPVLDPTHQIDWPRLATLDVDLDAVLAAVPLGANLPAGPERSRRLAKIRQMLAQRGHLDSGRQPASFGMLAQFVSGYRDIDLRDATGIGHGRLIANHGAAHVRQRWIPRLHAGELAGIAITEAHGGSQPAATRTHAVPGPGGTWLLSGRKTWISRLTEACVFIVFFRDPTGRMAAAVVDAHGPGLHRVPIPPSGLAGWSWGILDLQAVPIRPIDVLRGEGMALLRRHFSVYRPLVTATALGGAARVFDTVTTMLAARQASRDVKRVRDSALITIGRAHIQLVTALLGAMGASNLAAADHDRAELWGAATKAHGIDTANQITAELALLIGAAGFRADSPIAKTRRDLGGLLYADGIHDSLYRAAGKHHTASAAAVPAPRAGAQPAPVTA